MIDQPGVYDITDTEYFNDPVPGGSLSSSGARMLLPPSCPALFRHYQDTPRPPKREFDFGHAAHQRVIGGQSQELVVVDAPDWRTKDAKTARDEAYAAGKIPILAAENQQVDEMAAVIRRHPLAGKIFNPAKGKPEQSAFWQDRNTGIWRRARFDWLPDPVPGRRFVLADYKTTRRADLTSIMKHVWDFGYYMQAPWYCDAVTALGVAPDPWFVFVFQEKVPPYLITCVQLDATALAWGRIRNREAIELYAQCKATDTWPGYTDDIPTVTLPPWAERALEEEYGDSPITAAREIA